MTSDVGIFGGVEIRAYARRRQPATLVLVLVAHRDAEFFFFCLHEKD